MNHRVVFFTISMVLVVMGSVLFFAISAGAKHTQSRVLADAEQADLTNEFVQKGLFAFGNPSYFTQNHSCTPPYTDEVYASLVMQYQSVPRSCSIFVNDKLVRTERELKPECYVECPYEEFSRTVFIDSLDVRDNHVIEVCCNDVCIQKSLSAQCSS